MKQTKTSVFLNGSTWPVMMIVSFACILVKKTLGGKKNVR